MPTPEIPGLDKDKAAALQDVGNAMDAMDKPKEEDTGSVEPKPAGPTKDAKAAYESVMADPELSKGLKAVEEAMGGRAMAEEWLGRVVEMEGNDAIVKGFAVEVNGMDEPPKTATDLFGPMGKARKKMPGKDESGY